MKGKYLVVGEVILFILLIYLSNLSLIFTNGFLLILFALATVLGLYSVYIMGFDTLSPFPEPKKGARHIQEGAYRLIRHPMYTALIIYGLIFVLSNPEFLNTITYLVLICILDTKASYEETFLNKLYPTYKAYTKNTKKFIPFVY